MARRGPNLSESDFPKLGEKRRSRQNLHSGNGRNQNSRSNQPRTFNDENRMRDSRGETVESVTPREDIQDVSTSNISTTSEREFSNRSRSDTQLKRNERQEFEERGEQNQKPSDEGKKGNSNEVNTSKLLDDLKALQEENSTLKSIIKDEKSKASKFESQCQDLQKQLLEKQKTIEKLQSQLKEATNANQSVEDVKKEMAHTLELNKETILFLQNRVKQLEEQKYQYEERLSKQPQSTKSTSTTTIPTDTDDTMQMTASSTQFVPSLLFAIGGFSLGVILNRYMRRTK